MHESRAPLREVSAVFLKLGLTTFGGPLAHISAMEDEVVTRRSWMTRTEFADLLSVANLLPGPNSTELALSIGLRRAGWPGLLAAGACFIGPAVALVWLLAWAYVHGSAGSTFGRLLPALLRGMQPVVLAVIVQAIWRLSGTVLRGWRAAVVVAASVAALLVGAGELLVLAGAALLSAALTVATTTRDPSGGDRTNGRSALLLLFPVIPAGTLVAGAPAVFASFLKIGSLLFGSGYVLLAFLRAEFLEKHQWLTETQLLDAIAVGQVTPGPLFSSATFVGFLIAGHGGAVAATVGIFLPAFLFVAASAPLVRWLRASPAARSLLDGVNAASLALLASAALLTARAVVSSPASAVIFCLSVVLLLFTRVASAWLLLAGVLVGVAALRFPFLFG